MYTWDDSLRMTNLSKFRFAFVAAWRVLCSVRLSRRLGCVPYPLYWINFWLIDAMVFGHRQVSLDIKISKPFYWARENGLVASDYDRPL
jgi:hypothetical protein